MPLTSIHTDPLRPVLKSVTPPVLTTVEQRDYLWLILDLCCSDSRFAEKAYAAILLVLAGGAEPLPPEVVLPNPVITSLVPSTAVVGGADFTLQVLGTGFTATAVIHINGTAASPTTFVSATELTTPVDMGLVLAPVVAPITVVDQGVVSAALDFTVTSPVVLSAAKIKEIGDNIVKKHDEREGKK
jgi:hypothetical protein